MFWNVNCIPMSNGGTAILVKWNDGQRQYAFDCLPDGSIVIRNEDGDRMAILEVNEIHPVKKKKNGGSPAAVSQMLKE
jgi:hypothetical protein